MDQEQEFVLPSRVSIVDDDPMQIALMQGILGRYLPHVVVTAATSPEDALPILLTTAEAALPQVVISDVQMPGMNGWEFLQALKRNSGTLHLRVVMATTDEPDHPVTGVKALVKLHGAYGYVPKPIDDANFLAVVGEAGSLFRGRALVIEPGTQDRKLMRVNLQRWGFTALTFAGLEHPIELLKAGREHITHALVDTSIFMKSSPEQAKFLRQLAERQIPLVLLGPVLSHDRELASSLESVPRLRRPFVWRDLLGTLVRILLRKVSGIPGPVSGP